MKFIVTLLALAIVCRSSYASTFNLEDSYMSMTPETAEFLTRQFGSSLWHAASMLNRHELINRGAEGMRALAASAQHTQLYEKLRQHHHQLQIMHKSVHTQDLASCLSAFQDLFGSNDTQKCFGDFQGILSNISDSTITEATRDNQVQAYCDSSNTNSCANKFKNKLSAVLTNCDNSVLDNTTNSQLKKNLADTFKVLNLLCVPNTVAGDTTRWCFPKFAALSQLGGKTQDTVVAADLDKVCHPCVQSYFFLFASFQDNDSQVGSFFFFRILCLKDGSTYCTLYVRDAAATIASSGNNFDFNQVLNLYCANNCLNMLFRALLEYNKVYGGSLSDKDKKNYEKFTGSGLCSRDPDTKQFCLSKVYNAFQAVGNNNGCDKQDPGTGQCNANCKPIVQQITTSSGCCIRVFLSFLEDGNVTADSALYWLNTTCGVNVSAPCANAGSFVKAALSFPNIKYSYLKANADNEAKFVAACAKDTAAAAWVNPDKVSCVIAQAPKRIAMMATSSGTIATATILADNPAQASSIGNNINTAVTTGSFPSQNTNAAVPASGKNDPLAPNTVSSSGSTVTTTTSAGWTVTPAVGSLLVVCLGILAVVMRME